MADYRKLAAELCLADGKIDAAEVKIIKKALYEDGQIQAEEAEFLVDLRSLAHKKAKGKKLSAAFENFFFKALEDSVLDNGYISPTEATLLRRAVFEDGTIEPSEKKFIHRLKSVAQRTSPQFDRLYADVMRS